MTGMTVAQVLTREHREIDAGIEEFLAGLDRGEVHPEPLRTAFAALQRHIYVEEEYLFPPIRQAGLMMPIMVMVREHGTLWKQMAEITALLDADEAPPVDGPVVARCRELLGQLDQHNSKEEPIVYPHTATEITEPDAVAVIELLDSGKTPEGWVCAEANS